MFLSPSLLRAFRCVPGCTACCLPFTLDFTPDEFESLPWPAEIRVQAEAVFEPRTIDVNGRTVEVMSYPQYRDDACPFLRPTRDGGQLGCGFWNGNAGQPVECAAAPQLLVTTRGEGTTVLMKRPFSRGWKWQTRPQCEFDPIIDDPGDLPDDYDFGDEIGLLERYERWADHLGVPTFIPEVIGGLECLPERLRIEGIGLVRVA